MYVPIRNYTRTDRGTHIQWRRTYKQIVDLYVLAYLLRTLQSFGLIKPFVVFPTWGYLNWV